MQELQEYGSVDDSAACVYSFIRLFVETLKRLTLAIGDGFDDDSDDSFEYNSDEDYGYGC